MAFTRLGWDAQQCLPYSLEAALRIQLQSFIMDRIGRIWYEQEWLSAWYMQLGL